MSEMKLEKNVPMPPSNRVKYPWKGMEVGDSFLIPNGKFKRGGIPSAAKHQGYKVRMRLEGDDLRVWRTE